MNTAQWELPNPFLNANGEEIRTSEEWAGQRAYLREVLARDLYGEMPPAPDHVKAERIFAKDLWNGTGIFEAFDLCFGPDDAVHMKTAVIRSSRQEVKAIPIVLCGGYVDEAIAKMAVNKGFCIATPLTDDAAPDTPEYQKGTLYQAYPDYGFKVIAMWGWLMSRVADWLLTQPYADGAHLTVAGHSRYGKAALCAAVYDERFQLCVAAGSGCGGMGSLRVAGGRFGENIGEVETLGGMITGHFPHWFREELVPFGAAEPSRHHRENELRFDSDFIGAAIAPRPLLILEGLEDTWANPFGTVAAWSAVSEVYHFLNADEKTGISFREGGHAFNEADWAVMLDFCRHHCFDEPASLLWHTRAQGAPAIKRSWRAPHSEEALPQRESVFSMSPEGIRKLKDELDHRWAFGEAGLETGMVRMFRLLIAMQEKTSEL